jgi:hypothetical protein
MKGTLTIANQYEKHPEHTHPIRLSYSLFCEGGVPESDMIEDEDGSVRKRFSNGPDALPLCHSKRDCGGWIRRRISHLESFRPTIFLTLNMAITKHKNFKVFGRRIGVII